MRNDGGLDQRGNLGCSKKRSSSAYILKEETVGFVYVVYEKGKESRINPRSLVLAVWRMKLPSTKMEKAWGKSRLKFKGKSRGWF